MTERSEEQRDEAAARAIRRLADVQVPEGVAARIVARATAAPQLSADASDPPSPPADTHVAEVAQPVGKTSAWRYAGFAAVAVLTVAVSSAVLRSADPPAAVAVADAGRPADAPVVGPTVQVAQASAPGSTKSVAQSQAAVTAPTRTATAVPPRVATRLVEAAPPAAAEEAPGPGSRNLLAEAPQQAPSQSKAGTTPVGEEPAQMAENGPDVRPTPVAPGPQAQGSAIVPPAGSTGWPVPGSAPPPPSGPNSPPPSGPRPRF